LKGSVRVGRGPAARVVVTKTGAVVLVVVATGRVAAGACIEVDLGTGVDESPAFDDGCPSASVVIMDGAFVPVRAGIPEVTIGASLRIAAGLDVLAPAQPLISARKARNSTR
jgi:hypothetical protein